MERLAWWLLLGIGLAQALTPMPVVELRNAARSGVYFPAIGLGSGAYGMDNEKYGVYPECWDEPHPNSHGPVAPGCGNNTIRAVRDWFRVGGRRIDQANSYYNQKSVGIAMQEAMKENSNLKRKDIFVLTKIGPTFPLGYNETLQQFAQIQKDLQVTYVDTLLVHWPSIHPGGWQSSQSTDPVCNTTAATYDPRACRLSTWRAMMVIFEQGGARSIGVSNYNVSHLNEFIEEGLPLPAVNQCPFNPYRGTAQAPVREWCASHNVLFDAYSPLGVPDLHKFPMQGNMSSTLLEDPTIVDIARAAAAKPAQVILAWAWSFGVASNPRSMNPVHMRENLEALSVQLSSDQVERITNLSQDYCSEDPDWYECVPDPVERWDALQRHLGMGGH